MSGQCKGKSSPPSRVAFVALMYRHGEIKVNWDWVFRRYEGKGDMRAFRQRFFPDTHDLLLKEFVPFVKHHTSYWPYVVELVVMILRVEDVLDLHYPYRELLKRPHTLLPRKYFPRV